MYAVYLVGLWTRSLIALSPVHWRKGVRYNIVSRERVGERAQNQLLKKFSEKQKSLEKS